MRRGISCTAWRAAILCATLTLSVLAGLQMAYTNAEHLDLAGLPLRSEERRDLAPLVVAGDLRL